MFSFQLVQPCHCLSLVTWFDLYCPFIASSGKISRAALFQETEVEGVWAVYLQYAVLWMKVTLALSLIVFRCVPGWIVGHSLYYEYYCCCCCYYLYFYFMYMGSACLCICALCECTAYRGQKRELESLGLELQEVVSCHVGGGYWTRSSWRIANPQSSLQSCWFVPHTFSRKEAFRNKRLSLCGLHLNYLGASLLSPFSPFPTMMTNSKHTGAD